jgi:hypothetical protein
VVCLFLVKGGVTYDCYQPTLIERVNHISFGDECMDSVSRFDSSNLSSYVIPGKMKDSELVLSSPEGTRAGHNGILYLCPIF